MLVDIEKKSVKFLVIVHLRDGLEPPIDDEESTIRFRSVSFARVRG